MMFLGVTCARNSSESCRRRRYCCRDRDGALRRGLADDVAVELGDDLARRQLAFGLVIWHGSSSTVKFELV